MLFKTVRDLNNMLFKTGVDLNNVLFTTVSTKDKTTRLTLSKSIEKSI